MKKLLTILLMFVMLASPLLMRAQVQDGGVINGGDIPTVTSQAWNTSSGVSNEAEMLFKSLLPQQDSILPFLMCTVLFLLVQMQWFRLNGLP